MEIKSLRSFYGNPLALAALAFKNGVHLHCAGKFVAYLLKAVIFLPFSICEYLFLSAKINKLTLNHHPIFIIGHFRSGTTLLHKLMCADPQFAYFKNTDLFFPFVRFPGHRLIKRILKKVFYAFKIPSFAYNNVLFDLDDPQEEDMCIAAAFGQLSYQWLFVFPKFAQNDFRKLVSIDDEVTKEKWQQQYLYYLKRISYKNNGKRLLLKNPPNTARVKAILELFPDAKFIFLYRNPESVIFSTKRIWSEGLKHFSLQKINDESVDEIILELYIKLHSKYEEEKVLIPKGNLLEIQYEQLERLPLVQVESIYELFELNDRGVIKIKEKIEMEKTYSKFQYTSNNLLAGKVNDKLHEYIRKWNYAHI